MSSKGTLCEVAPYCSLNLVLVTYGKYDVGAIITQVTNGNGSMPAFGDKLGPDDIEDVGQIFQQNRSLDL